MKNYRKYIFLMAAIFVWLQMAVSLTAAALPTANATASGGFLNSTPVTFKYTGNYICNPASNVILGNSTEVTNSLKFTNCEVGGADNTSGEVPLWITIPAYSGLSIFGVNVLGASSQGFPMYANSVILTECGAGGTTSACPDHPTYVYSPVFTAVEQHMNITNGIFGLPEGVLPTPAHSHIVATNASGANVSWDVISVLVLDPNIMPNATTGKCTQVVTSNLTNATGNCLTSLAALQRALTTTSNDVHSVNANNPIYQTLAGNSVISLQVLVPGDAVVTQLQKANTNVAIPFEVKNVNFYAVPATSSGFLNSKVATFTYSSNYTCTPAPNTLLGNSSEVQNAMKFTNCEDGVGATTNGTGTVWTIVPLYAGLSIEGRTAFGGTASGYPVYANTVVTTSCGAGGTPTACPSYPTLLYSPVFTEVEQHLGIKNGTSGLPEGVLPTPAMSRLVATNSSGVHHTVSVLVLDPNIMPNATTGKCTQVVQSNLTNATGNCLTSVAALQRALVTSSNDVAVVNANNPIYQTIAGNSTITMQVIVPGATSTAQLQNATTNIQVPFSVAYAGATNTTNATTVTTALSTASTSAATTVIQNTTTPPTSGSGSSTTWIVAGIVVLIIIVGGAWWMMKGKKKPSPSSTM